MRRDRSDEDDDDQVHPVRHYKDSWVTSLPPDLLEKLVLDTDDFYTVYNLTRGNRRVREFMLNPGRNLLERWATRHIGPDPQLRRFALLISMIMGMGPDMKKIALPFQEPIQPNGYYFFHVDINSDFSAVYVTLGNSNFVILQRVAKLLHGWNAVFVSADTYGLRKFEVSLKGKTWIKMLYALIEAVSMTDDSFIRLARDHQGHEKVTMSSYEDYVAAFLVIREWPSVTMVKKGVRMQQGIPRNVGPWQSFEQIVKWLNLGYKARLEQQDTYVGSTCQTCISGRLSPGKASHMLHEGRANGRPLTDKQRRFFACRAHGGCGYGEDSAELVIDLLNRRTRKASHQALAVLSKMFLGDSGALSLEFSNCDDKNESVVYPGFKTGYANGSRIHICTDSLGDAFNAQHSKTISYDAARVTHYAAMFLHEFGHVLDKRDIEYDNWYGGNTQVERRADAFAQWFINKM